MTPATLDTQSPGLCNQHFISHDFFYYKFSTTTIGSYNYYNVFLLRSFFQAGKAILYWVFWIAQGLTHDWAKTQVRTLNERKQITASQPVPIQ